MTAPKFFSSGRQSDNFEDWRLPHSSFRSWCSKFSETLVELSDTSKIVGPSPLRSQVIRNHDRQKECFLTNFWEKKVCFTKLTPRTPPSVIHGWKATDLLSQMVKRKNYLLNPVSRQNFANALAENHNLKLEVCHMLKTWKTRGTKIWCNVLLILKLMFYNCQNTCWK